MDSIIDRICGLSEKISKDWLEEVIWRFCHFNRMLVPQSNIVLGQACLKIVEVLKRLRGIDSVFELLFDEEQLIYRRINDPAYSQLLDDQASRV